jgi:hypothetical protein
MTVTTGPDWELQVAVVAALRESAGLKTLLGDPIRLYQKVPVGPTFPYITIGQSQEIPDRADCVDGSEVFLTLHVWSRTDTFGQAKKIIATIWAVLNAATITTTENRCLLVEREDVGSTCDLDPDGETIHGVTIIRGVLEPV